MGKQDIKYDQSNYRDHDERNLALIKKSIQRCGAGRSILLDKNGEIIERNLSWTPLSMRICAGRGCLAGFKWKMF